jgi:hypothetical protein
MSFLQKLTEHIAPGRQDITVKQYISRLQILNDNNEIKNLAYLKDLKKIQSIIAEKAQSTRASYYSAIIAALNDRKDYTNVCKFYKDQLMRVNEKERELLEQHIQTERQKKYAMEPDDIKKASMKWLELINKDNTDFIALQNYMVLGLFTDIPPRRNQDYTYMFVVRHLPNTLEKDKNYCVLSEQQFIFNHYKTSSVYGTVKVAIPDNLFLKIMNYLERHPFKNENEYPFIVNKNGDRPNLVNGFARILERASLKRVGSTAFRHFYLSEKYADTIKEMKNDEIALSHSSAVQKQYIKYK